MEEAEKIAKIKFLQEIRFSIKEIMVLIKGSESELKTALSNQLPLLYEEKEMEHFLDNALGEYVYVVNENTANRRSVESVYNANGVCITKGLNVGEQVVLNADVFSDNTESVSVYVKAVK